jgi:CRP-like cAMP-binding protein
LTIGSTKEKILLKRGDVFGERALIEKDTKRSGTIVCVEDSVLFCVDGAVFREVIKKVNQSFFKERIYFLSLIPIFSKINN